MRKFTYLLFYLLAGIGAVFAQTNRVTGVVISADDGDPVIGASVVVKGATGVGIVTNMDGEFTLNNVPSNATTLVVSYIGMITQEAAISPNMRILLRSDAQLLDEVVVTALGISRERKSLSFGAQDMKGEELSVAKDPNLLKSIAGKVSGVNISSTTGALGSSARIQIRGISSFSGNNQPLFIVDGTPITNERLSYYNADMGNNSGEIDPETIESMSILKGPSATALYGSRALNGVVLITTKQGKVGKKSLDIIFNSGITFDRVSTMPKYQNMYGQGWDGSEFEYNEYYLADGGTLSYQDYARRYSFNYVDGMGGGVNDDGDESWGPRLDAGLVLDQFHGKNQPWISHPNNIRNIYQTAVNYTNSFTLNASAENIAGRITYTNDNLKGVMPNTDLKRNNINGNLVFDNGIWLKVDLNITYHNEHSNNLPGGGYNAGNPMQMAGWFGRQVDTKLLKENWNTFFNDDDYDNSGYPYNWISLYHNNPWFVANKLLKPNDKDRVYGNLGLTFTFTPDLKLLTRIGYDHYSYDARFNQNSWDLDLSRNAKGAFEWNTGRRNELNLDAMLNFNKHIGDINISAMAGTNFREFNSRFSRLYAAELLAPNFFSIRNVKGNPEFDYSVNKKQTNSVFGSLNLGYNNYLYLDVTARNDWTSALSPDNWSYFYPSTGLSFIFTDAFNLKSDVLSYGKFRASWAQVGSDTDAYALSMVFNSDPTVNGWNQYRYTGTLVYPLLRPQRKTSVELGSELRFLKNRINLDVTWYRDNTKDQIMDVPISFASGYNFMKINAGVIQNSGVEVTLGAKIFDNPKGFNWTSTINWSTNKSKVIELHPDIDVLNHGDTWGMVYLRSLPGGKLGDLYTYVPVRDEATGKYLTDNGGLIKSDEMENVGNALPDWIGGWHNEFRYKNFNFSFLINTKKGGTLFPMTAWFGVYSGVLQSTVEGGIREHGVLHDGIDINTGLPNDIRISAYEDLSYGSGGEVWNIPGRVIMDASFVKLQEIIFGYTLPNHLTTKIGFIKGANIAFVGRNVALLYVHKSNKYGIDPDTMRGTNLADLGQEDYSASPVRSLGFKLTLNF